MRLQGKVALVTGSAVRVGKTMALALAREGASIVLHSNSSAGAAHHTAHAIAALGVEVFPFQADLREADAIAALFQAVQDRFGRLDVLVNSASTFVRQPFDEVDPDSWQETMQVNLLAPFLCSQHAARLMSAVDRPAEEPALIVNIADLSGIVPWRGFVQHGVSKAGLIHLTKIAAYELAPDIRVNAIVPGAILPPPGMDADQWHRLGDRVPLRRTGNPDQVGQTVVFLAANDTITGAVIPVDGGEHLTGTPHE
jgi:NAD(P)-dependent dehydrogenase (short-subunit alcohol dehydrogenase family)